MSWIYLLLGFISLILGGELLVRASVGLSLKLNLSRMIIGLTVVSFATSAPELIVSIQSAVDGLPGLAVGNVVGSNIANIGLVLAVTALISPLAIDEDFYKFNWPWMLGFTVLCCVFLIAGKNLLRWEGVILLILLGLFIFLLIQRARRKPAAVDLDLDIDETNSSTRWWKIIVFLVIGGAALWMGSEWLVQGAVSIATDLEIPESVIGVSMIAIGTSVPELAASIIAALKKEKAISLGNLIGSNIFNIASVLGITALIEPIYIKSESMQLLDSDIWWMLAYAAILLPLGWVATRYRIGRWKGLILLGGYSLFLYIAFSTL
jgi:cation:H+ antiporter